MQSFVAGRAIRTALVAGSAAALVHGCAVLRGKQVGREEQERRGAACAREGAKERKFHLGMDFITLTPQDGFVSPGVGPGAYLCLCACNLKADGTSADVINGVVYESAIHTIPAFSRRVVLTGANLELDNDLHQRARREVSGRRNNLYPSGKL